MSMSEQELQETEEAKKSKKHKDKPIKSVPVEIAEWILTIVVAVVLALGIRTFLFELVRVDGASMNDTLANGEVMLVSKLGYTSVWKVWPWVQDAATCDNADRWTIYGDPSRGDVVICRYPERGQTNFVKRVLGLPGDTVAFEDGYYYLNGEKQEESFLNDEYREGLNSQMQHYTVPAKGDALTYGDGYLYVNGVPWRWGNGMISGVSADGVRLTFAKGNVFIDEKELTLENGIWKLGGETVEENPLEALTGIEFLLEEDYYFVCGDHRNNSNDSRSVGPIARSMIMGHVKQVIFPLGSWRNCSLWSGLSGDYPGSLSEQRRAGRDPDQSKSKPGAGAEDPRREGSGHGGDDCAGSRGAAGGDGRGL